MRQYKESDVIMHEIYFDTAYESHVKPDSIQQTSKGPYVHYKRVESGQWGRKKLSAFIERFKLTQPIGSSDLKRQSIERYHKANTKANSVPQQNVSSQYNNVIYVDFVNRCVKL